MSKPIHQILIQPLLTEKSVHSTHLKGTEKKKYTFRVALNATKLEIANAIEELYVKDKVKVEYVHTLHMRPKQKRTVGGGQRRGGAQKMGFTAAWKKAIVTLTADSPNIAMLEGV